MAAVEAAAEHVFDAGGSETVDTEAVVSTPAEQTLGVGEGMDCAVHAIANGMQIDYTLALHQLAEAP